MAALDDVFGEGTAEKLRDGILDRETVERIRDYTNPEDKPTGHFTGRCMTCYSNDIWDDAACGGAYGCKFCDSVYPYANIPPKVVPNAGFELTPEMKAQNKTVDEWARKDEEERRID